MPPNPMIDHLAIVKAARAKYAGLPAGEERAWKTTNEAALRMRERGEDAGIFWKGDTGTNYQGYNINIVMYSTTETFDCLGDAENKATPQWNPTTPTGHGPASAWRMPIGAVTIPDPPPGPPPTTPGIEAVLEELTALRLQVAEVAGDVEALRAELRAATWPVELRAGFLGTVRGTVGPQA